MPTHVSLVFDLLTHRDLAQLRMTQGQYTTQTRFQSRDLKLPISLTLVHDDDVTHPKCCELSLIALLNANSSSW